MFLWSNPRIHFRERYDHEASKGPHRGPGSLHDSMHCKFCSKPPVAFDKVEVPKKATTMGEQQLNEYEKMGSVHRPWAPAGGP